MITQLSNPYVQALLCSGLMLVIVLMYKLDVGVVLMSGLGIGLMFILCSLFYGVYFNHTWMYLLHALFAAVIFSAFWLVVALIANKFGRPVRNGEGWMIMMAPLTMFPAIFVFAVISKLVFDLIRYVI